MTSVVSIVVPAHDPGPFLAEALRSLVAQDHEAWDCVVVDDGSSEDLSWVEHVDPRISRLRLANRGPAGARNAGVAATQGPYVAFLDADDLWRTDKLTRQLALLDADVDAVLCHSGAEVIDESGQVIGIWPYAREVGGYADLFRGNGVGVSSAVVRRSSLIEAGGWNVFQRTAEDLDLWLRLSLLGAFVYDAEPLTQYRRHGANASGNAVLMASGVDAVFRQHETLAHQRRDHMLRNSIRAARRAARQGWGATSYDQARQALRDRHAMTCLRRWVEALRLNPRYTLRTTLRHLGQRPGGHASVDRSPPDPTAHSMGRRSGLTAGERR